MGCSCKANTSVRKQVTRVVKRSTTAYSTHSSSNQTRQKERKQVIIRRPAK